jgi:hypothetical protein
MQLAGGLATRACLDDLFSRAGCETHQQLNGWRNE